MYETMQGFVTEFFDDDSSSDGNAMLGKDFALVN